MGYDSLFDPLAPELCPLNMKMCRCAVSDVLLNLLTHELCSLIRKSIRYELSLVSLFGTLFDSESQNAQKMTTRCEQLSGLLFDSLTHQSCSLNLKMSIRYSLPLVTRCSIL